MFNIFKSSTEKFEGKNFYSYNARNSNGEEISMSTYLGKVCMVVNLASQYEEAEPSALNFPTKGLADENFRQLAELDKRYRNEGLCIIGFPTNQFAGMEPAIQEEIVSSIQRKYNVDFEIFEKVDVNGPNTHPLFDYLKTILQGTITNDIKWHFTKFLIDRNGNPVKRYAPNDPPLSFEEEIRHLLRQESVLVKGMQAHLQGQGQNLPGQAGLQGQIGQGFQGLQGQVGQQGLQGQGMEWEGKKSEKDWEREKLEKQPGFQAQTFSQGRGEQEQKNLNIGGGQGLQYEKKELKPGEIEQKNLNIGGGQGLKYEKKELKPGEIEQKNLNIGGGQGAQYQKMGGKDKEKESWGWGKEKEEEWQSGPGKGLTMQQIIGKQLQREMEVELDHLRAAVELKRKGLTPPDFYFKKQTPTETQSLSLQQIIDMQLDKENELDLQHKRAEEELRLKGITIPASTSATTTTPGVMGNIASTAQSYAQVAKEKVVDTAQVVKEKVVDTAHAISDKLSGSSEMSERQQGVGFKKQESENLTGEGGTVGAQMGVHLGAHSVQAGVQAGKDPLKLQEQKK